MAADASILIQNGGQPFPVNVDYEGTGPINCAANVSPPLPAGGSVVWNGTQIIVTPPLTGGVDGAIHTFVVECSNACSTKSLTGCLEFGVCTPGTITMPDDIGADDCTAAPAAVTYDSVVGGPGNPLALTIPSSGFLYLCFDQYVDASNVVLSDTSIIVTQWTAASDPSKCIVLDATNSTADTFTGTVTNSCGSLDISGTSESAGCTNAPTVVTWDSYTNGAPADPLALVMPASGTLLICFDHPVDPAITTFNDPCMSAVQWTGGGIPANCLEITANGCTNPNWTATIANACGSLSIGGTVEGVTGGGTCTDAPIYVSGGGNIAAGQSVVITYDQPLTAGSLTVTGTATGVTAVQSGNTVTYTASATATPGYYQATPFNDCGAASLWSGTVV